MPLDYPFIPDGDPLEFRGVLTGAKADLVKGSIRVSFDVPVDPKTINLRNKLALLVEGKRRVYIEVQPYRMPLPVEAAEQAAAEAAVQLHQLELTVEHQGEQILRALDQATAADQAEQGGDQ